MVRPVVSSGLRAFKRKLSAVSVHGWWRHVVLVGETGAAVPVLTGAASA